MSDGLIRTNDGVILKDALRKSERRQTIKAISLVAPLGLFLLAAFIIPIGLMLFRSVDNKVAATALSASHQALQGQEAGMLPSEKALATVASELAALRATGDLGKISQRLNRFYPGMDSGLKKAAKEIRRRGGNEFKALDSLASSTYDYADLSGRLWQLTSEHSRLAHLGRIFGAQKNAIKENDSFANGVSIQTNEAATDFLDFASSSLSLSAIPEIDIGAAQRFIASAQTEITDFPNVIGTLEDQLAGELTELDRLKAILGTSNTAAAALADAQNENKGPAKPVTQTQSEEYAVSIAQRQSGETRSLIQSHKEVIKALETVEGQVTNLQAANVSSDTLKILDARAALAKTAAKLSQHGTITKLDETRPLIREIKAWLSMRDVKPIDGQELKSQAFKMFDAYPYLENSKYDTYQALFTKAKKQTWTDPTAWSVMERMSKPYVADYFLRALDLKYDPEGKIVREPENRRIFVWLLIKTMILSAVVALGCLLLGYPLAYLLATVPTRTSNLLMIFVLLPFWTSLLVRTTAWLSILSREGVINNTWVSIQKMFGAVDPWRFEIAYTWKATLIAMIHILLPFMILPVFSVMKNISPTYMRAGRSLGATGFTAFRRVYFPQTLPGIGAGALLVFILAIGYFITPALVGGADGVLISNMIQTAMQKNNNPQLAAASGSILLILVLFLYWLYNKVVGVDSIKLG